MQRIYKYPILGAEGTPSRKIEFSKGAELLSAGYDLEGQLCIWAIDKGPEYERVNRMVYCIGTGWPLDLIYPVNDTVNYKFLATVKSDQCMWHIFYGPEEEI